MIINIPDDLPTTLTKVLTALCGISATLTEDTGDSDVVIVRAVETDEHTVNLLAHPFVDQGEGYPRALVARTQIVPASLVTTISVH